MKGMGQLVRAQRGAGTAEYLILTTTLIAIFLVPFGNDRQNVIDRLVEAIKAEHSAYIYVTSLPKLPESLN